ncbi:MAG: hemerythrin domain-containing protein [Methanomassiliicoccus sp.]|nr:hemerythrin domain-containing protein [Methanomassiliicoccus sp.]
MDVFDEIRDEHKIILITMEDLIGRDPETRRRMMNTLSFQIIAHLDAEERSVYKAFENVDGVLRPMSLRHAEEHRVARFLLSGLRDEGLSDEHWAARLHVLRLGLEQHFRSEEKELFDAALDYFDQNEIDAMTHKFDQVKAEMLESTKAIPSGRSN